MSQASFLFVVLIGIDKYRNPSIVDLHGAVNDANSIEDFLLSEVGVSKDRIVKLYDEEATREGILNTMRNLINNSAIRAQDPILIYYAGHGSEASSGVGNLLNGGRSRVLLPHDFGCNGSNTELASGIYDATLDQLFADIAARRSDNISVILDCCHAGSRTRNFHNKSHSLHRATAKYIGSKNSLTFNIIPSSSMHPDDTTGGSPCTLLAACAPNQFAMEIRGRGVFTSALLTLLKREGISNLSYQDVIMRLPDFPDQDPQCEGVNSDRILFSSKVAHPHLIPDNSTRPMLEKSGEGTMDPDATVYGR